MAISVAVGPCLWERSQPLRPTTFLAEMHGIPGIIHVRIIIFKRQIMIYKSPCASTQRMLSGKLRMLRVPCQPDSRRKSTAGLSMGTDDAMR